MLASRFATATLKQYGMNFYTYFFPKPLLLQFDSPEEFDLFRAVDEEDVISYNTILNKDVSINAIEHEYNSSILHWACENGSWKMVKMITIHPKLNQANMFMLDKYKDNCLTLAIFGGSLDIVRHLVEEHGMDINNNATAQRPLLWAVECRRPSIFTYFLNKQVDTHFIVKGTSQPFLLWVIGQLSKSKPKCNDPSEVKIYIQSLLTHNADVSMKDEFGNTALCYAVALKDISLVTLLCEFNADVNCNVNNSTMTLLEYAHKMHLVKIAAILTARGARANIGQSKASASTKVLMNSGDIYIKHSLRPASQSW